MKYIKNMEFPRAFLKRTFLLFLVCTCTQVASSSSSKASLSAYIPSLTFERQTWNNCGPASVVGVLGAYGFKVSQEDAKKVLRPTGVGYMTVDVIDGYVQQYGLRATHFRSGNLESVKRTIDLGIPVLVLQWLRGAGEGSSFVGEIPHFRTVRGYDDKQKTFWVDDPMLGANATISYKDFLTLWGVYNNDFIPIYPKGMESKLERTLGVRIPRT